LFFSSAFCDIRLCFHSILTISRAGLLHDDGRPGPHLFGVALLVYVLFAAGPECDSILANFSRDRVEYLAVILRSLAGNKSLLSKASLDTTAYVDISCITAQNASGDYPWHKYL
jgi:hypothetical protein